MYLVQGDATLAKMDILRAAEMDTSFDAPNRLLMHLEDAAIKKR
jgi:hypothetical protein